MPQREGTLAPRRNKIGEDSEMVFEKRNPLCTAKVADAVTLAQTLGRYKYPGNIRLTALLFASSSHHPSPSSVLSSTTRHRLAHAAVKRPHVLVDGDARSPTCSFSTSLDAALRRAPRHRDETKIKDGRDDLGTHRMDRLLSKTHRWTPGAKPYQAPSPDTPSPHRLRSVVALLLTASLHRLHSSSNPPTLPFLSTPSPVELQTPTPRQARPLRQSVVPAGWFGRPRTDRCGLGELSRTRPPPPTPHRPLPLDRSLPRHHVSLLPLFQLGIPAHPPPARRRPPSTLRLVAAETQRKTYPTRSATHRTDGPTARTDRRRLAGLSRTRPPLPTLRPVPAPSTLALLAEKTATTDRSSPLHHHRLHCHRRTTTRRPRGAADWGRLAPSRAAVRGRLDSSRRWPGGRTRFRLEKRRDEQLWGWSLVLVQRVPCRHRDLRPPVSSSPSRRRQSLPRPHGTPRPQATRYPTSSPRAAHAGKALTPTSTPADKAPTPTGADAPKAAPTIHPSAALPSSSAPALVSRRRQLPYTQPS
ncbi:hypothetical protein B0H13DRAFT_2663204 [Mycena leptocephala]|nr:hypothetical protein B0H13DRAFT_2663204 [Mycena leptocephala]